MPKASRSAEEIARLIKPAFNVDYRNYWEAKLNNFAAGIDQCPKTWRVFHLLDDLFQEELVACKSPAQEAQIVPLMLMIHSHSQLRVAMELGFSLMISEAGAIIRTAIESGVYAFKLFREPDLVPIWAARNTKSDTKLFDRTFKDKRREKLFTGVPELTKLYEHWCQLSEVSSHSTLASFASKVSFRALEADTEMAVNYFESDMEEVEKSLFLQASAMLHIENLLRRIFCDRLNLLPILTDKRLKLFACYEEARRHLNEKYDLTSQGSEFTP